MPSPPRSRVETTPSPTPPTGESEPTWSSQSIARMPEVGSTYNSNSSNEEDDTTHIAGHSSLSKYHRKRLARSQSPVLPAASSLLLTGDSNSNTSSSSTATTAATTTTTRSTHSNNTRLSKSQHSSPTRGRSKSFQPQKSLVDETVVASSALSSRSSNPRSKGPKGPGHQTKRSFGSRFFSKLKDNEGGKFASSSGSSGGGDKDFSNLGLFTKYNKSHSSGLGEREESLSQSRMVVQQENTIQELNKEIKELRERHYNNRQFRTTVEQNIIIYHGVLLCKEIVARKSKFSLLRSVNRWIMMTWSSRISETNQKLQRLRKKEHETHSVVLRNLLFNIQTLIKKDKQTPQSSSSSTSTSSTTTSTTTTSSSSNTIRCSSS